jgi:hypothetical protein
MKRQLKEFDDDDGRVICDMDVDGMRWHDRRVKKEKRAERRTSLPAGDRMTKSEAKRFTRYAVLAALTIVAVYAVVWAVVILFMTQIWFR